MDKLAKLFSQDLSLGLSYQGMVAMFCEYSIRQEMYTASFEGMAQKLALHPIPSNGLLKILVSCLKFSKSVYNPKYVRDLRCWEYNHE